MQKIFVDSISGEYITLDKEQSRHLSKSLRMKIGDIITACDGTKTDYGCMIESIDEFVTLKICYKQASKSEPSVSVTLYQGVPKSGKMEDIIQKCTELGITKIVPVLTKRSVSRPDAKSAKKKNERYKKIALEAAQQSGRGIIPEIAEMTTFANAVKDAKEETKIVFYEGGGERLKNIINENQKSVAIFIGPEGGFEKDEVDLVIENGGINATLGERILRTQTAPVAALTAIMLLTNNM